jgi:hypothetical protein
MGVFQHEAAAVDPVGKRLYLTEDISDGGFYRFTPARYPDLSAGLLEIARVGAGGAVDWLEIPDPAAATTPTRRQVPGATKFRRGEGMWFDSGTVYVATTSDSRIHAYDTRRERIEVLYEVSGPFRTSAAQTDQPAADGDDSPSPESTTRRRRSRGAQARTSDAGESVDRSSSSSEGGELPFSGYPLAGPAAAGAAGVAAGIGLRRVTRPRAAGEHPREEDERDPSV